MVDREHPEDIIRSTFCSGYFVGFADAYCTTVDPVLMLERFNLTVASGSFDGMAFGDAVRQIVSMHYPCETPIPG